MLLKVSGKTVDLAVYRMSDDLFDAKLGDTILSQSEAQDASGDKDDKDPWLCSVCLGVLQHCDNPENLENIQKQVKKADFEFNDFKITFACSAVLHFNKRRVIFDAEKHLGKKLEVFEKFQSQNYTIDFREVFKWIVSPLLVNVFDGRQANLDGKFLVHCSYTLDEPEDDATCSKDEKGE